MELIHHRFDSISSTNDWAKEQIAFFQRDKVTIVSADSQTSGRGQYGRSWLSSSKENIYISFCFFISEGQNDPLSLTHLMAIAVAQLLEEEQLVPQIKWPNDVLIDGKKIAGILCETVPVENMIGVIIGVGLNVNMTAEMLALIGRPATSLAIEKLTLRNNDGLKSERGKAGSKQSDPNEEAIALCYGQRKRIDPATPQPLSNPSLLHKVSENDQPYDKTVVAKRLEELFITALEEFLKRGFTPFLPTFRRLVFKNYCG